MKCKCGEYPCHSCGHCACPDWISLEHLLPENNQIVLCCDVLNKFVSLGRYLLEKDELELMFIDKVQIDSVITHWMPLPLLPKEL